MRDALISFPMFGENFVIDPPAYFSIGNFNIYMYGVIIAIGFLLAVFYISRVHDRLGLSMDDIYDLVIFAVPTAIVGARLYYVVFNWSLYAGNFASVFAIRDGGLAIYGGVIGAIIALWLRCRAKKLSFCASLDVAGFGLLIGQFIGRWGNFFNREAFGYETDIFCRMGLTTSAGTMYVHPTFLYESLWNFVGFLILHFHSKKKRQYAGQYFLLYVIWYGIFGFVYVYFREQYMTQQGREHVQMKKALMGILLLVICSVLLISPGMAEYKKTNDKCTATIKSIRSSGGVMYVTLEFVNNGNEKECFGLSFSTE
ncbi:MAG: prolipoprotein diacylglyceryl transferase, partial [Oscillospiraceae bacterium]|nr:prolipoprotein diacylglyceryl transferase [Oscillospiraceae bacterium]